MLGSDDFHAEPRPPAPEPSLEEMLRRAQAAPLDAAGADHDAPMLGVRAPRHTSAPLSDGQTLGEVWRRGVLWLMAGTLLGALLFYLGVQASAALSDTAPPPITAQAVAPTPPATPLPTATTMPIATDTPAGALTPTVDEIVAVVRDYINNGSIYTGAYELTNAAVLQTQGQGQGELTACVAYDYASITPGDTSYGDDTRLFTLAYIDSAWTVTQMGDPGSCTLN